LLQLSHIRITAFIRVIVALRQLDITEDDWSISQISVTSANLKGPFLLFGAVDGPQWPVLYKHHIHRTVGISENVP
jgi:hypothetical protein